MELLFKKNTKQQSKLQRIGSLGIQTAFLGGPVRGTEPNRSLQVWCVGIQLELILD